ncbi:MAG: aquaporin [Candidatus Saccharibacteria bacterium]|nr:aquaporin [Candidatus Saccharibacteria bacterium]MDO4398881.1 aquaporin [Candidatus Saccharibacteria bacterium]
MATKKSKTSTKSTKAKSTKGGTAEKSVKKSEIEAPKTNTVEETKNASAKKSCFCGFFAKKYEEKESILTIFKSHKFYGALLGEVIGTMLIALLLFALSLMGIANVAMYAFAVIAVLVAVYAFSGACLNPIVTVGMMATRRMSVIRGIMYIIAEILGAWLGWLIFNGFHLAGGETAYDVPTMSAVAEGGFWMVAMVELLGAAIIGFFFSRAIEYKRSTFTFAAVIAGGMALAVLIGYVVSAAFLGINSNFIFNPAVALMMQIFPTAGENFGEIFGGVCQALSIYALIPMIGGVIGFYLSDFAKKLSED